ncbi:MAG: hypothetical protein HZB18_17960 [Chloroflexi bacterium]|nr:hypothetical protein [Chloroflexota bacterium]
MFNGIKNFASRWTLAQHFRLTGLVITILGTLVIGRWVADQIKTSVINETAAATALYLDSFIAPNLQVLSRSKFLPQEDVELLNKLLTETNLGRNVVTVKVWDAEGLILYSNRSSLVGHAFPGADDLSAAWQGQVMAIISDLQDDENIEERRFYQRLLEIYIPIRQNGTHQIIAVAEFYQEVDVLEAEIVAAQRQGWLVVVTIMASIYLLMFGFVQGAGNRIRQQEVALKNQVAQLTEILSFNDELDQRVRRATANTTLLNESLFRRVSAELHEGPVQEISLALLRIDQAMSENEVCRLVNLNSKCNDNLPIVQTAIQAALQEIRVIATGLGLPQLGELTLPKIISRAIHSHEQLTGTTVSLSMSGLPDQATLPIKITAYRFIQEALNNAHKHAGGVGQQVRVTCNSNEMQIEVSDQGPGFDVTHLVEWTERLGLVGMRERVESMGGMFKIESKINEGTKVAAHLSLQNAGEYANG